MYTNGMEPNPVMPLVTLILSGLVAAGFGGAFMLNPGRAADWLRPIGSSAPHPRNRVVWLSRALLAVGIGWIIVFLIEVIPFPYARPFWMLALSEILLPASMLGFLVLLVQAFRPRK
jgi:hypothetical protein